MPPVLLMYNKKNWIIPILSITVPVPAAAEAIHERIEGGACSKCTLGHQGRNNLDAALRHTILAGARTTIFSQCPNMLLFVITGDVDF